jgi:copper transport protein
MGHQAGGEDTMSAAIRRVLAALGLVAVALAFFATPASAHATLLETSPAEDQVLKTAPTEVVLTFDESVSAGSKALRVFDPSGTELPGLKDQVVDNKLSTKLPKITEKGSYTVSWNVISADGHPVGGTFLFHYLTKTLTKPKIEATGTSTPFGAGLLRVLGAVALFGALTFIAGPWWFGRRRVRDRRPWLVAVAGGIFLLLGGVWVAGTLGVFVSTTTGLVVCVLLGLVIVGTVVAPTAAGPPLATLSLITAALPGHAVSLAPVSLSATFTVIHVLCAAAWITNLFQLERVARDGDAARLRSEVLRRSPVLMGAVALLAGTGLYNVIHRVGWTTLFDTTYGKIAAIKLVLLVAAVSLAAYHRFALAPQMSADPVPVPVGLSADVASRDDVSPERAVNRFRTGIRAEMVIVAAAVVLGAMLGQFNPAGAGGEVQGGPFDARVAAGAGMKAELSVYPGKRGRNDLHLYVFDANGNQATDIHNLELTMSDPVRGVNGIKPTLTPVTESHAVAQNVQVPFAGEWTIELTGSKGQFTPLDATWQVPFGS